MSELPINDVIRLIIHFGLGGPRPQVPAAASLVVTLVLDGDFAEMAEDVLHLRIASATALTAEIVEPFDLVHEVVYDGNDDLVHISGLPLFSIVSEDFELTVTPIE